MQTLIARYSTILLLAGIVLSLLALRRTLHLLNQSRRAPYYILREEAARSGWRWALVSLVLIVATVVLAVTAAQTPAPAPTPVAESTATPGAPVPTLGATATRRATPTATALPSPTLTSTPTLTPTAVVAPDVPAALLTPIPNAATPDPAARFEFLTLASRLDAGSNPLDPGLQFPTSVSRVYVFFRASGVNDGAPWGIFCYRDDAVFDLFVALWDDGPNTQTARAFCSHDGRPGTYGLRAYIGTTLAFEVQYSLVSAPPTATP